MNSYRPKQFKIFRIIFGSYLTWHFYNLVPYGVELFTTEGIIKDPYLIPTWGIFPIKFDFLETEFGITSFLISLTLVSILFTLGIFRRISSLFLLYGWLYLLNRNIFISNPGIPYVGWLLLICTVIPPENQNNWKMPSVLYFGTWFLLMGGYTISGLHKLQSPSWIDGTALETVLLGILGRENLVTIFLLPQPIILQVLTWFSLWSEILSLFLGLFYHIRKWYWLMLIFIHIGILFTIDFVDLTLGMLMIHFFLFDTIWLKEFPFRKIK